MVFDRAGSIPVEDTNGVEEALGGPAGDSIRRPAGLCVGSNPIVLHKMITEDQKNKLVALCKKFVDDNKVSCPEATINDGVYENAPELVGQMAEIVGYFEWPQD